jgi:hypothetical protein
MTIKEKEKKILDYLENVDDFRGVFTPTEVGMHIFGKPYAQSSSYANNVLKHMVKKGVIRAIGGGYYEMEKK